MGRNTSYRTVKRSFALVFKGFLLLGQLFPLIVELLLVEASVVKLVAFVAQQQMVAQDLGVVDLVFQFGKNWTLSK